MSENLKTHLHGFSDTPTKFNNRLQVTEFNLGIGVTDASRWKMQYEYGELNSDGTVDTSKNTGNIARTTSSFAGLTNPFVQSFKYDSLYRLIEATEKVGTTQTWKQNFGYDRFGNRTSFTNEIGGQVQQNTNITHPSIDAATNRFSANQGYTFDKNGNLVTDAANRSFKFNGENKQAEVKDSAGNPIGKYFYDGEGKRIKKETATEITIFVYSGGRLIAEYSTLPPPANPTTSYTMTDHLDSPRVITNAFGEVTSRRDFKPFGEELPTDANYRTASRKYGIQDNIRQRFTGYQKDVETNLDFAEARMYQNLHGRFTAVDPLLASGKSANPQTFNRYVYVLNNPLVFTDPTGLQVASGTRTTRQIVFVFIFDTENEKESRKMWNKVIREAKNSRIDLRIFRGTTGNRAATVENYITAITTEGAIVISNGHARGDNIIKLGTATGNAFRGNGIVDTNGDALTTNGIVDKGGEVYPATSLQITASKVIINSCDITDFVPFLVERMKPGAELIYNNAGKEGLTGALSNEQVAIGQVRAIMNNKDPVKAGQQIIDQPNNQNMYDKYGNKFNAGDKIVRVNVLPKTEQRLEGSVIHPENIPVIIFPKEELKP